MYIPDAQRYEAVDYRATGRWGLKLPPISLGLWQNFGGADVFETGRAIIRRAFDRGVTHFDLANNYGPLWLGRREFRHRAQERFSRPS